MRRCRFVAAPRGRRIRTDVPGAGRGSQDWNEWRRRIIDVFTGFHGYARVCRHRASSRNLKPRATTARVAGMIDRPDRDIETGTAGASRHCERSDDGQHERSVPYPSRPRPALGLGGRRGMGRRKFDGWQC
jgi:hypothetical protein